MTSKTNRSLDLRTILKERFGFRQFRAGQAKAVRAALDGRDTVVIMPTGSGKSLCFQLPALELVGTTVVVSPLIALMKDQTDALKQRGLTALAINSTLSAKELGNALATLEAGEAEFVYATPERMASPEFRSLLKQQPIDLFVVDEAHCVTQWGNDFRPEYLALKEAIADLGRPPVLAMTATATQEVIEEIQKALDIPTAEIVHTGFYRPNLYLSAQQVKGTDQKDALLDDLLATEPGTGIIYVATIRAVEELTERLSAKGWPVVGYHGRMSAKRRTAAQNAFMAGETKVVVATNAFGLGIDKADIRFVAHYQVPGTIDAYYQEVGRAGRDGAPASCLLFYDPEDLRLQRFFVGGRYPDETDLVNCYHALSRLNGAEFDFASLAAISPLGKALLKVCLRLLVDRQIVRHERNGSYRLLRPGLSRDQLARLGQSCCERHERELLRQQQMVEYAEGGQCRWKILLNYFGDQLESFHNCGCCDYCGPRALICPANGELHDHAS